MHNMKRITLTIDAATAKALKEAATKDGERSLSSLARAALTKYLAPKQELQTKQNNAPA
jgi:metal-responsive CopG/Arc/MetJ family transcriptional regulator